jgi:ribose 5-phosphate isomerase B
MKIAFASDHAGFEYKKELMEWLKREDYQVLDFGAFSEESVDYPDYAFPAAEAVAANIADYGILICGSGIGMAITANKVTSIRAANCYTPEMAELARRHNNANVLCLGSRLISLELAKKIVKAFIEGEFEGGRHMIRVEKIHFLTGW